MKNRNNQIGIRIVPRHSKKDFGTILLFILLLPYVVAALTGNIQKSEKLSAQGDILITYESDNGTEKIPMETFLMGQLAASIPIDFEEETLKAQAVILRTNLLRQYQNKEGNMGKEMQLEETGQHFLTPNQMKLKWGANFEANYSKVLNITNQMKGIRLSYEGTLITAPYFYSSAGKTRSGNEVLESNDFPYLQSVDTKVDLLEENIGVKTYITYDHFFETINLLLDMEVDRTVFFEKVEITTDQSGYVKEVSFENHKVTGEIFRNKLELPSACFAMEAKKDSIEIVTKGLGHGVGLSQYGANNMAKNGADYTEILNYYYSNIEIIKE